MLVLRPPGQKVVTHRLLLDLGVRAREYPVRDQVPSGRERSCAEGERGRV